MLLFTGADDVSENTMEMNKSKSGKGRKKLPVRILKGPKTDSKQVLCSMCVVFICWYCSKRGLGFRTCVQSLWHVSIKYVQFKKRKFNVGLWHLPWHACFNIDFLYLMTGIWDTASKGKTKGDDLLRKTWRRSEPRPPVWKWRLWGSHRMGCWTAPPIWCAIYGHEASDIFWWVHLLV